MRSLQSANATLIMSNSHGFNDHVAKWLVPFYRKDESMEKEKPLSKN